MIVKGRRTRISAWAIAALEARQALERVLDDADYVERLCGGRLGCVSEARSAVAAIKLLMPNVRPKTT